MKHLYTKHFEQIPFFSYLFGICIYQRWSKSFFLTPAPVPKKVTPAPALELFGNLHSDSCLHSESLKVESILPHEVK